MGKIVSKKQPRWANYAIGDEVTYFRHNLMKRDTYEKMPATVRGYGTAKISISLPDGSIKLVEQEYLEKR